MAEDNIDKALPNVEQTVKLPAEAEIVEAQETIDESLPGEPEVIEQEDGSVDINVEQDFGMTPIFYYMGGMEPTLDGIDLFDELGANLYHKLDDGTTLEEYIIEKGHRPFAKVIRQMKRERRLNYLKTELAKKNIAFSK